MLLKIDFKTVNTVLSHTFNHKTCFKYAVYIVGCVLFIYCCRRPSLLKVSIVGTAHLDWNSFLFSCAGITLLEGVVDKVDGHLRLCATALFFTLTSNQSNQYLGNQLPLPSLFSFLPLVSSVEQLWHKFQSSGPGSLCHPLYNFSGLDILESAWIF